MLPNSRHWVFTAGVEFHPACSRHRTYASLQVPSATAVEFYNFVSVAIRPEELGVQSTGENDWTESSDKPRLVPVTLRHLRQLSYLPFSEKCAKYLITPALRIPSVVDHDSVP